MAAIPPPPAPVLGASGRALAGAFVALAQISRFMEYYTDVSQAEYDVILGIWASKHPYNILAELVRAV
jgi:hypothetical protein